MCDGINSMRLEFYHPTLPLTICVLIRKLLLLPEPQFTYPQREGRVCIPNNMRPLPVSNWSAVSLCGFCCGHVLNQRAGTGCSLMIRGRWGVVEQLCTFVGPSLPVPRFPRLFKFMILGHCGPTPYHAHHVIHSFFPRVCFKEAGRFSEVLHLLISCPLDIWGLKRTWVACLGRLLEAVAFCLPGLGHKGAGVSE